MKQKYKVVSVVNESTGEVSSSKGVRLVGEVVTLGELSVGTGVAIMSERDSSLSVYTSKIVGIEEEFRKISISTLNTVYYLEEA